MYIHTYKYKYICIYTYIPFHQKGIPGNPNFKTIKIKRSKSNDQSLHSGLKILHYPKNTCSAQLPCKKFHF